jgi:hypothetical protein
VYSRELEGETLTIVPAGWTYKDTFVLYDRESGTLWYPYRKGLKGIQGKHFEKWLPKISSKDTQLRKWLKQYPDSKILK